METILKQPRPENEEQTQGIVWVGIEQYQKLHG